MVRTGSESPILWFALDGSESPILWFALDGSESPILWFALDGSESPILKPYLIGLNDTTTLLSSCQTVIGL
jgi:hypothetical protein